MRNGRVDLRNVSRYPALTGWRILRTLIKNIIGNGHRVVLVFLLAIELKRHTDRLRKRLGHDETENQPCQIAS